MQAFDMFVASANRPLSLRSGLPLLDRALHGGIRPGGITEVRERVMQYTGMSEFVTRLALWSISWRVSRALARARRP